MTVALIQADCNTSTGNQDFTESGFGTVEAAFIYISHAGAESAGLTFSYGFSDGGTSDAFEVGCHEDAQSRSDLAWRSGVPGPGSNILVMDPTDANKEISALLVGDVSFISNGVRINWTTNSTSGAYRIHIIMFGGGVNTAVGAVTLGNNTTPITTTLGWQPDVLFIIPFRRALNSSMGIVVRDGSTPPLQVGYLWGEADNKNTTEVFWHVDSSNAWRQLSGIGGTAVAARCTEITSTGFVTQNTVSTDSWSAKYLAVQCPNSDLQRHTSTGAKTAGFQPELLFALAPATDTLDSENTTTDWSQSFGAATTASNEEVIGGCSLDNVGTSDTDSGQFSYLAASFTLSSGNITTSDTVSLTSMDAAGYTLGGSMSSHQCHILALSYGDTHIIGGKDATHAHAADRAAVTEAAGDDHQADGVEATHAHAADRAAFIQNHSTGARDATHAHAADRAAFAQTQIISGEEATHAHSADRAYVEETKAAGARDATHAHAVDRAAVSQTHTTGAVDATHAHIADRAAVSQINIAGATDATHAHVADRAAVSQINIAGATDATHAHTADRSAVAQSQVTAARDATHAHVADRAAITQVNRAQAREVTHAHVADRAAVSQINVAGAEDSTHAHVADRAVATQANIAAAAEATHAHVADRAAVSQINVAGAEDSTHSHVADRAAVSQIHVAGAVEATHAHTADRAVATAIPGLAIAATTHAHTVDRAAISQVNRAGAEDATHAHTAEKPLATTANTAAAAEATHAHTADRAAVESVAAENRRFYTTNVADGGLNYVKTNCDRVFLCSQEPTTYAEASSGFALLSYNASSGDFTLAAGPGSFSRKLTLAEKAFTYIKNGTGTWIAWCDLSASEILYKTRCSNLVVSGSGVTLPEHFLSFDPVGTDINQWVPSGVNVLTGPKPLDDGLDYIKNNCNRLVWCSQKPLTFTEANATYKLADVTLTGTDFSYEGANMTRFISCVLKTVTGTGFGTATYGAWLNTTGSELLVVFPVTSQVVIMSGTYPHPRWLFQFKDFGQHTFYWHQITRVEEATHSHLADRAKATGT
jgi:hypothetical protein